MKTLLTTVTFCFVMLAGPVAAGESDRRVMVAIPANTAPITVSSDSKLVKDMLRKHKERESKNKTNKVTQKNNARASAQKKQKANVAQQQKPDEPIIVHLEGAENQPPVTNNTRQFIFKDVTQRSATAVAQPDDLAKRTRNIELLRQQAARR